MTTTDNIVRIYPEAVDQPGQGTPEDLAQQVFYEIEIIGQDPTRSWERFTAKLASPGSVPPGSSEPDLAVLLTKLIRGGVASRPPPDTPEQNLSAPRKRSRGQALGHSPPVGRPSTVVLEASYPPRLTRRHKPIHPCTPTSLARSSDLRQGHANHYRDPPRHHPPQHAYDRDRQAKAAQPNQPKPSPSPLQQQRPRPTPPLRAPTTLNSSTRRQQRPKANPTAPSTDDPQQLHPTPATAKSQPDRSEKHPVGTHQPAPQICRFRKKPALECPPPRVCAPVTEVVINVGTLHDPDYHLQEVTHDSVAYYMREGEAPGRWAGSGATALGLSGEVTSGPIHDLFDGKNPNTGEYLIPSKGSNRRARDRRGERVVDVKAAAAQLGIKPDRVRDLLSRGKLAGTKKGDGHWEVPQPAIDAYRHGDQQPPGGPRNLKPAADGTVSLAQAAEMAGVSSRYLRKIAVETVPPPVAEGPDVQYLLAVKAGRTWRVHVDEVARFMEARNPARVVEAYDLAVRAPKSVSLLHALGEFVPADAVARCHLAPGETVTSVVLSCHQEAVADVVGFLERHAAFVRGPGGKVAGHRADRRGVGPPNSARRGASAALAHHHRQRRGRRRRTALRARRHSPVLLGPGVGSRLPSRAAPSHGRAARRGVRPAPQRHRRCGRRAPRDGAALLPAPPRVPRVHGNAWAPKAPTPCPPRCWPPAAPRTPSSTASRPPPSWPKPNPTACVTVLARVTRKIVKGKPRDSRTACTRRSAQP